MTDKPGRGKALAVHRNGRDHFSPDAIARCEKYGGCFECCDSCNYGTHTCMFCGTDLRHDSTEYNGERHWLSDCRPDLTEHEPGEICTWSYRGDTLIGEKNCYAFQNSDQVWTDSHSHFMKDGPLA